LQSAHAGVHGVGAAMNTPVGTANAAARVEDVQQNHERRPVGRLARPVEQTIVLSATWCLTLIRAVRAHPDDG
jgi:hypothetical protein